MAGSPTGPLGDGGVDLPGAEEAEDRDRRRAFGRLIAIVVVVGLVIAFVVENTNPVTVHLWIVDRSLALVWVIAGCIVVGLAVGYWVGWQGHRHSLQRRAARQGRRRWGRDADS
jgi:uncharacterized integral membrane protein